MTKRMFNHGRLALIKTISTIWVYLEFEDFYRIGPDIKSFDLSLSAPIEDKIICASILGDVIQCTIRVIPGMLHSIKYKLYILSSWTFSKRISVCTISIPRKGEG